MKFGKSYREYIQAQQEGRQSSGKAALPAVDFKRLKKLLKNCSNQSGCSDDGHGRRCSACDDTFFPSLRQEMSAVVRCFNRRARNLLKLHLVSGFRRCFVWIQDKILKHNHSSLTQEGKDIVAYAIVNSIAMRKILKKYDKIHQSKRGQAFRSQALSMNIEILQSPWLCELMAFYINTTVGNRKPWATDGLLEGCSLGMEDEKPVLSCSLFDSLKLNIDLTCSICLDTVFDTVALSCGHILCYMCACRSASVSIVSGLKSADWKAKCPLCRQGGVFHGAIHLRQLNILLSRNCHEYWQQRRQTERIDRVRLAKEHWDHQCRAFMGI